MASISIDNNIEKPKTRSFLTYIAIIFALSSPIIQRLLDPIVWQRFPYPWDRFASLWIFWIAVGFAIFVSVRIEGIPLTTFGLGKNTRTLRYRLIEMIGALLLGLLLSIVIIGFSGIVRSLLNVPVNTTFNINKIPPIWVMFPAWITAAFCEEFLFRAYPIERITMLTGKRWFAAALSCFLFIVLHLFGWDWIHVATIVAPAGILITGIYLWRRSLWFVAVVHAVLNVPVLFLPLIAPYL